MLTKKSPKTKNKSKRFSLILGHLNLFFLLEKMLGLCLSVCMSVCLFVWVRLVQNPRISHWTAPLTNHSRQRSDTARIKKTPKSNVFLLPIRRCVRPQIASVLHVFSSAEEPSLLAHPALTYCCAASCCDLDQQLPKFNRGGRTTQKPNLGLTYTYGTPGHWSFEALKNAIIPYFVDAQVLEAVFPPLGCGQVCSASSSSSSPYLWLFRWLCLYFRNELKKSEPQVIVFFRIWFPANEPRRSCHSCRRRARGRTVTPPWKMGLFCRRFGSASIRLPTE